MKKNFLMKSYDTYQTKEAIRKLQKEQADQARIATLGEKHKSKHNTHRKAHT